MNDFIVLPTHPDLQSIKPIRWTEVGNFLESLLLSLSPHNATASDCEFRCIWNRQLYHIWISRYTHRMVSQWKIHHKWWCSRKQQVNFKTNFTLKLLRADKKLIKSFFSRQKSLCLSFIVTSMLFVVVDGDWLEADKHKYYKWEYNMDRIKWILHVHKVKICF